MNINIIVAASKNHVIGLDNTIPWRCPSDLKRFKKLTKGHHILMGRKTFESLPDLLPNRTHLIITRDLNPISLDENTMYFNSILDAINYAYYNNEEELFIIGGGEIYKQCINICNKIYFTIIDCNIKGDSYFKFNEDDFLLQTKEFIVKDDAGDEFDSQFFIYEKI